MTAVAASSMDVDARPAAGLRAYYDAKIEQLEVALRDKTQNLRRLEAQRNELNGRGASSTVARTSRAGGRHARVNAREGRAREGIFARSREEEPGD